MRPIDFVVHSGDSTPNRPAYQVAEAMLVELEVHDCTGEKTILSYYYDENKQRMILEIE